jgi:hypothetical protein
MGMKNTNKQEVWMH